MTSTDLLLVSHVVAQHAAPLLEVLSVALEMIPYYVVTLDFANDPDLVGPELRAWATRLGIQVTGAGRAGRRRTAQVSRRSEEWVRLPAVESAAGRAVLNGLWELFDDRSNYFTPIRRPVGWSPQGAGRRTRQYDELALPVTRLLAAGVISRGQQSSLMEYRERINPACVHRNIHERAAELGSGGRARPGWSQRAPAARHERRWVSAPARDAQGQAAGERAAGQMLHA